jgi:hypothetical protein
MKILYVSNGSNFSGAGGMEHHLIERGPRPDPIAGENRVRIVCFDIHPGICYPVVIHDNKENRYF